MSGYQSNIGWVPSTYDSTNLSSGSFSLNKGDENEIPVWDSTRENLKKTSTYLNTEQNNTISITDNSNQTTGDYVTQLGVGVNTGTGDYHTSIGFNSGSAGTNSFNTTLGAYTLFNSINSLNSTVVGHGAGRTGGTNRPVISSLIAGTEAAGFTGELRDSTVMGTSALRNAGDAHTAVNCIGTDAARDLTGSINNSQIFGNKTLEDCNGAITNSQIFGSSAGESVSADITSSTVIGHRALMNSNNLTVNNSILMGYQAAYNRNNSSIISTVGIGERVLTNGTDLSSSVVIGKLAGVNLSGTENVAIGFGSLYNASNSSYSTCLGVSTGLSSSGGNFNLYAGCLNGNGTDGNYNVFLGYNIGNSSSPINNSIAIRAGGTGLNDVFTPESDRLLIGTQDSNILLRADLASGAKNLEPGNDNEVSLGTSSKRWSNIYSHGLNVSGTSNTRSIVPSISDSYNLGSTSTWFNSAVIQNYYLANRTTDFTTLNSGFNAIYANNGILKYASDTTNYFVDTYREVQSATVRFNGGTARISNDFTIKAHLYASGAVHLFTTDEINWDGPNNLLVDTTSCTLELSTGSVFSIDSSIEAPNLSGHRFPVTTTDSWHRFLIYFSNRSTIGLYPFDAITAGEKLQFNVWYNI